ncbi:MAG: alkanesulfonate monooxygenase [Marmoricola sp.]|jgi:alkanesulfonate monooxygenase|nr:alkanesulfonate monooxygenase [Marmoricola sp.]
MSIKLHWFLPTTGDARSLVGGGHSVPQGIGRPADGLGTANHFREPDIDYLATIARTADQLGYEGVLTPTGTWCEDAWLVTSALIRETRNLKFLVAFRPGVTSPTLSAQMAAAFQRISNGRLLLNVVTGGEPVEQKRFGDHLSKAERYARTDEFLTVVKGAWEPEPFDFHGEHYQIEGAEVRGTLDPIPQIYFGGSSAPAGPVAARHADVYLTWGEPLDQVEEKIRWIRGLAAEQGRDIRFGLRIHTLSRDTSERAWQEAQWLLDGLDPATIEKAQAALAASESTGQQRMRSLHGGRTSFADAHDLEIAPNLWSGVGLVRGGAGTALVGSHQEVADRLEEYHRIGIDEFILSGYPHVEEAYWFAEGVMPILGAKGIYGAEAEAQQERTLQSVQFL